MLSNAEMNSRSPAPSCSSASPRLRRRLRQGAFAAIDQRIGLRVHIEGMEPTETAAYLRHLGVVGRADALFSDDAVAVIHQASRGMPGR